MDVATIQLEIINRLGAGARTTADKLVRAIDEADKRIYSKLVKVHEKLFYGSTTFPAINGRSEYTVSDGVPSNIKKILRLETRYSGQDRRYRCTKAAGGLLSVVKMDEISTSYLDRYHPKYYEFGSDADTVIGFLPSHDAAGADYNKVWYLKRPTTLTEGAQTPITPEDGHFLLVEFGLTVAQLIEDEDATAYLALLRRFDQDVMDWIESENPSSSEPLFTVDATDDDD